MKKLLTIAMISLAALAAKADLFLYWTVDASGFDVAYAEIVANDGSGIVSVSDYYAIGAASSAKTQMYASSYTDYLVKLYNSSFEEIAISSSSYAFDDLTAGIWDTSEAGAQPPSSPYTFTGFVIPEPTSGLMLLLGLAGLALKRKLA